MMRRVSHLVIGVAILAVMAAPAAQAGHSGAKNPPPAPHEGPDTTLPVIDEVKAVCEVVGAVTIGPAGGGVSASETNHNHYTFIDTVINCAGDANIAGAYDVTATGGTDGEHPLACPVAAGACGHGEWDGLGWGHSSGFAAGALDLTACAGDGDVVGKGNLSVDRADGKHADGFVEFLRVGAEVVAHGSLDWTDGKKTDCFVTELTFVPTDTDGKVNTAILAGPAHVGN